MNSSWIAVKDELVVLDSSGSVVQRCSTVDDRAQPRVTVVSGPWMAKSVCVRSVGRLLLRDSADGSTAHIVEDGTVGTTEGEDTHLGWFGPGGQP